MLLHTYPCMLNHRHRIAPKARVWQQQLGPWLRQHTYYQLRYKPVACAFEAPSPTSCNNLPVVSPSWHLRSLFSPPLPAPHFTATPLVRTLCCIRGVMLAARSDSVSLKQACGGLLTMSSLDAAYSIVKSAPLKARDGSEIVAQQLWKDQPVAVFVVRRPGCILCREEAQKLWVAKSQFDQLGVELVCIVHEYREKEIAEFTELFWPGPLYLDETKAFYKALNAGQILRMGVSWLLNPFSMVWRRIFAARKCVVKHNAVGEGTIMGGFMLVRKGSLGVQYLHLEQDFGLHAPLHDVIDAAQKAAAAAAS